MRAGDLKHLVEIQRYTETKNSFGETIAEWYTVTMKRASISPISGKEYFVSKQVNAETTHRVYMRYTDLKTSDRLVYDGRIFNIESILNHKEQNVSLEIICTEQI